MNFLKLVWFAAKQKEKVEKRPAQAQQSEESTLGTMDADLFMQK